MTSDFKAALLGSKNHSMSDCKQYFVARQLLVRPHSVDFSDGGATDVPILGPME